MRYTTEKALYFASQPKGLHVADDEAPRDTDLHRIRTNIVAKDLVEEVARDDSGAYYKITEAGKVRLLELQIQWREQNGKPTDEHRKKLSELRAEA